jgi:hypothetical protein
MIQIKIEEVMNLDRRIWRALLYSPAECNENFMLELSRIGVRRDSGRTPLACESSSTLPPVLI